MENTNIVQYSPFSQENSYLKLNNSELVDITIENAAFNSCLFYLGTWKRIIFKNCNFHSCVFDSLDLSNCIFENCTFAYCRLDSCKWSACEFSLTEWKKSSVVHGQWVLCQLDMATTDFVDEYSNDQEDEMQNTATWTLSKKMTFSA